MRTPAADDARPEENETNLAHNSDICKIIFAIILPPLGVFLERGCGADLLINICLTILGWLPGVIHAFYIIFKY
ncbi:stress response RCI peptide [Penicillium angulare]|uniref:Stress response RCI peptide n=1 Tax=Penicillium angulare TaxID=116970 RepID=A0A9W9F4C0_9EURO|nr:stress response RCI peptide [Penicillium angulare]